MPNEETPQGAAAEVTPEDFNAYEERYYGKSEEEPSDEEPSEAPEQAAESAADSEPADDPETDEEEKDEEPEEQEPRKKSRGVEKRISKLVRERDELKRQLADKSVAKPAEETSAKPAAPAATFEKPKPALEDFDSIEAFTDALTDWKADERDWRKEQATAQKKANDEQQQVVESWKQREAGAREVYADYDAALAEVEDIKVSPALQRAILLSDHGAHIAYTLAKDPAELKRIAALDPIRAAAAIGKLEARFDSAPTTKPAVSRAPKPPSTVSGGRAAAPATVYDESLASDFSAWERKRNAELRKRRGY
jgi:hypothetical protein